MKKTKQNKTKQKAKQNKKKKKRVIYVCLFLLLPCGKHRVVILFGTLCKPLNTYIIKTIYSLIATDKHTIKESLYSRFCVNTMHGCNPITPFLHTPPHTYLPLHSPASI